MELQLALAVKELKVALAVVIFVATSGVLATRTPFRLKKTPVIILLALAFAAAYTAAGAFVWSAGYPLIAAISWLGGMLVLARRMFKDAMTF